MSRLGQPSCSGSTADHAAGPEKEAMELMREIPTQRSGSEDDSRRLTRPFVAALALLLLLGAIFSGAFYLVLVHQHRQTLEEEFRHAATDRASALAQRVDSCVLIMEAIEQFYAASRDVERDEFRTFVAPFLRHHPCLKMAAWVPEVKGSQRAAYEAAAAWDGCADYRITEYDKGRRSVCAAGRARYYPVFYAEPYDANKAEPGLDLASVPAILAAMNRARDSGDIVATGEVALVRETGDEPLFLMIAPIYGHGMPTGTVAQRQESLEGYVVGVFLPQALLEEVLSAVTPAGIDVVVLDRSGPKGSQPVCSHRSRTETPGVAPIKPEGPEAPAGLVYTARVELPGRPWTIVCTPAPAFVADRATWGPLVALVCGLLLTVLLAMLFARTAVHNAGTRRFAAQLEKVNRELRTEVTQRKRAEEKYWLVCEKAAEGILVADVETRRFSYANPAACRMLGYGQDELTRLGIADIHPQEDLAHVISEFEAQARGEKILAREIPCLGKDGNVFYANVNTTPALLDGRMCNVGFFTDVTERKRAEEASRRETAKLSAMIAGMEEGVVFADADNVIVEINDYLCRFVGKPRDEILGKRIEDFHQGESLERIVSQIEGFRNEVGSGPLVFQKPLGGAEVILRMQPIYRDGRYDGVLLNVVDVSELVEARHQAEIANEAKSAFLANMSHEIRTPMTGILGYADLMMDPQVAPSDRLNYLAVIRRNGEHLLHLINDILDLSKIEAGKLTLDVCRCSIVSILADVASIMRPRADQRGNALSVKYLGPMPETVLTDGTRLRQALVNLVGNAIKFTKDGEIQIATSLVPDFRDGEPAVRIDVIDTGIGIAPDVLPRLFQPFVQAETSTARKFGGTGLGLTISRHIAEMLGGTLEVQSTVGRGSTFSLTVPTGDLEGIPMLQHPAEAGPRTADETPDAAARDLEGLRILLAEDGFDNQELIRTVLSRAGADVEIAENGRVAVDKAGARVFDVILMDMNMPEMDGYEATRMLRTHGYDRPILALTAYAMSGDAERCLAEGCDAHLTKPIDRTVLVRAVAAYAGQERRRGNGTTAPAQEDAPSGGNGSLESQYADDPSVAAILGGFVSRLAGHVAAMREAMANRRCEDLRRLAHQLKGSGGSYGYPALSEASKALEDAARAGDADAAGVAIREVARLCRAIEKGYRPHVSLGQTIR